MPHDQEAVGSNPAGCWSLFYYLFTVSLGSASFNVSLKEVQHYKFFIKAYIAAQLELNQA